MVDANLLVTSITGFGVWLPLLIAHSLYLHWRVEGHLILGERKLVHRLLLLPLFRCLCSLTYVLGQLLVWSSTTVLCVGH